MNDPLSPLTRLVTEPLVRSALLEDLGLAGDLTSESVVPHDTHHTFEIVARESGTLAGLDLAALAFELVGPRATFTAYLGDGDRLRAGDAVARVSGPARSLLAAERVALNFLGHLCGVATATATLVDAVAHTRTRVCCTRKTTPGLRAVEKHAVRAGGGVNHRFGLDDAVLVKDNHLAVAGSVTEAVRRVRARVGHLVAIEVEVDSLEQLDELLRDPVHAVLLDNMSPQTTAEAVRMVGGRMVTEASGRITAETAPALAEAGVDLVSAGWITHSAPVLDLGLDATSTSG
ncbi:carboxylating nicotinate-nucleotide diphosphorylase [Ornithinimicrobium tianjinense]|uniref:Nicotinate-nucleotide pyrophosphorylase [carboxylating] n=1 Tax=Ornithinimicrobium tianjinense TaxID=1195761 RepID=A0A917F5H4_9MICO|nr:carboxylating nicotinate-nucleotide diphosphorylase [Ornithinimicrobium tianjinense]GGF50089.1 nicotinate-nucleotide diphosphorylase (carboxylating) [Ornithinimicrobium tianjinense]